MGILQRLFSRQRTDIPSFPSSLEHDPAPSTSPLHIEAPSGPPLDVVLYGGGHDLEVVGESFYQDALWRIVGARTNERVRLEIQAVLFAETDNPYDENAISVWINEMKVGHLSREDAEAYRPGLLALQAREGKAIALSGVVVGGGVRLDGPGMLGVWMSHDPADFGVAAIVPPPTSSLRGSMRTGLTEALLTDDQDDSYDLSWLERLPSDPIAAVSHLRGLLQHDPDPIDRHFMYCELEDRLYRSRDAFSSALQEYEDASAQHDTEMDGIREALFVKFGKVPLLDTYRQMAIRQQKVKRWTEAIWWAQRGLSLYGQDAARPEAVDDLKKRIAAYEAKLSKQNGTAVQAVRATRAPARRAGSETLICVSCGSSFERPISRGRKPQNCPSCR